MRPAEAAASRTAAAPMPSTAPPKRSSATSANLRSPRPVAMNTSLLLCARGEARMAGARPGDLPDDVVQEDSGSHGDVQRGDVSAHGQADQEVTVFTDEPAQSPSLAPHHDGGRGGQMGVVIH